MISPILGLMGSKDLAAYNTVMRAGLSGNSSYPTPAQAKADAAITLAWGSFLNSIVNFLIISFAVFNMIKVIGLFYRKKQAVMTTCFWCKVSPSIEFSWRHPLKSFPFRLAGSDHRRRTAMRQMRFRDTHQGAEIDH